MLSASRKRTKRKLEKCDFWARIPETKNELKKARFYAASRLVFPPTDITLRAAVRLVEHRPFRAFGEIEHRFLRHGCEHRSGLEIGTSAVSHEACAQCGGNTVADWRALGAQPLALSCPIVG
jgi:hypothetical protein